MQGDEQMDESLMKICDQYITRCTHVLATKDSDAAKLLRTEATCQFHKLIPRWRVGLMASITHFYLDDIENILGKLMLFRKQIEIEGDREIKADCQPADRAGGFYYPHIETSFEHTYAWIRENYAASATEKADILDRISELQRIARSHDSLGEKWDQMRSFIEWIRNKSAELAAHVLPLMAKVLEQ